MKKTDEICVLCEEAITNPVCLNCIGNEIAYWLREKKPEMVSELYNLSTIFGAYTHDGSVCILCNQNMNVCAHCYTKEIFEWLNKESISLSNEFLESFNYEHDEKRELYAS